MDSPEDEWTPPGWLSRMSDEDRGRLIGLFLLWGRSVQRRKAVGDVGSMELLLADTADPASVADALSSTAVHLRDDARWLEELARVSDEMTAILRRAQ